jgi:hypothetical protein
VTQFGRGRLPDCAVYVLSNAEFAPETKAFAPGYPV